MMTTREWKEYGVQLFNIEGAETADGILGSRDLPMIVKG